MDPITRKEMFLAKAGGQSVKTPEPITREEMFLQIIAENGSSASIDVTASVGQTIVVEEVDANGNPTKWKAAEYQEKICGSEETVILPETTAEFYAESGSYVIKTDMVFEVGKIYGINYCGTQYIYTAVEVEGIGVVGNIPLLTGTGDDGSPFVMFADEGQITIMTLVEEIVDTVTVAITSVNITTIPVEYIPDKILAYAPVYVSCVQGENSSQQIPMISVSQLEALIDAGRTVIVKVKFSDYETLYFQLAIDLSPGEGYRQLAFTCRDLMLALTPQDDDTYIGELRSFIST